jgi:hypothetical protein
MHGEVTLNLQVTKHDVDAWMDDLLTRLLLMADEKRVVIGNVVLCRPLEERK